MNYVPCGEEAASLHIDPSHGAEGEIVNGAGGVHDQHGLEIDYAGSAVDHHPPSRNSGTRRDYAPEEVEHGLMREIVPADLIGGAASAAAPAPFAARRG